MPEPFVKCVVHVRGQRRRPGDEEPRMLADPRRGFAA